MSLINSTEANDEEAKRAAMAGLGGEDSKEGAGVMQEGTTGDHDNGAVVRNGSEKSVPLHVTPFTNEGAASVQADNSGSVALEDQNKKKIAVLGTATHANADISNTPHRERDETKKIDLAALIRTELATQIGYMESGLFFDMLISAMGEIMPMSYIIRWWRTARAAPFETLRRHGAAAGVIATIRAHSKASLIPPSAARDLELIVDDASRALRFMLDAEDGIPVSGSVVEVLMRLAPASTQEATEAIERQQAPSDSFLDPSDEVTQRATQQFKDGLAKLLDGKKIDQAEE